MGGGAGSGGGHCTITSTAVVLGAVRGRSCRRFGFAADVTDWHIIRTSVVVVVLVVAAVVQGAHRVTTSPLTVFLKASLPRVSTSQWVPCAVPVLHQRRVLRMEV